MYLLREIPMRLMHAIGWASTVTLTVNNDDPCFDWINEWLATHAYAKRARMLTPVVMPFVNARLSACDRRIPRPEF
jgi:hypothetical protein